MNIHVCLLTPAKSPQHCPNLKTVQKQSEERAQGVHLALKTPRLRHLGLQCDAVGTGWFTFSETVFDGWDVRKSTWLPDIWGFPLERYGAASINRIHF